MKREQKVLVVSAVINVLVFTLKIIGGLVFSSMTLIMDGIYTISDFVTDILAIIGSKIGRKRANKKHPFGYGRFEYIMQGLIGVIIFMVGCGLLIYSFFIEYQKPNLTILFVLLLVILFKGLSSNYLFASGKKISSVILINSAKESFLDVLSSLFIVFVVIFGQWFSSLDFVGSICISLMIVIEGISIVFDNVVLLIGEDDNNKEIKSEIKKLIEKDKDLVYADSFLIKNGSYYQVEIEMGVNASMSVRELLRKELRIRKALKNKNKTIKFISFNIRKG